MNYDVAIVGGGPAGSVAALTLKRAGLSVALIDRKGSSRPKVGESLLGAARPLLVRMDLLPLVESGGHLPCYGNVSAWGSSELASNDFIRDPHGLGWHLDREKFDGALKQAAIDSGVHGYDAVVNHLAEIDDSYLLTTSAGKISSQWLVDATGRNSAIASRLGSKFQADYPIMAAVTWVRKKDDSDSRTFIESVESGWWYSALLPDGTRIVSFHTLPGNVIDLVRGSKDWRNAVAETTHLSKLIAGAERIEEIHGIQACGGRLDHFAGKHWVAVGDAALSLDPLSSQGIFNAIYTGWRGARAILSGSTRDYEMRLEAIRDAYLQNRRYIYSTENRWNDSPFWRTQHDQANSTSALSTPNRVVH